jgi:hypothetical protein
MAGAPVRPLNFTVRSHELPRRSSHHRLGTHQRGPLDSGASISVADDSFRAICVNSGKSFGHPNYGRHHLCGLDQTTSIPYLVTSRGLEGRGPSTHSRCRGFAVLSPHRNPGGVCVLPRERLVGSAQTSCLLTIVGGVRERLVLTRRGRGKTVCARGA